MSEDIGAAGASALVSSHMSNRMSSRIAVVGGRRRWSVDQKLAILREAFGPDGSVSATCPRHAVGSGMLYTWRRQALAGDLTGAKRTSVPSFAEVEVSVPTTAPAGSGHIGIELPSGVRLTVDAAVDTDALARVMSVLAR
jgi:transposase